MSLTVKHPFTSAIADDPTAAAAGQILPQAHWNANHTVTGSVDATQMPALTGDVTTAAGAVATTLATVNANTGTFGDSTHVAQVTLNGKGLVTAASSVAIAVSATPAGSTTQVQFNDAGAFAGNAQLTFDKTSGAVAINSAGAAQGITLLSVINSNLAGAPGIEIAPANGMVQFKVFQGNSNRGLEFRDYNSQSQLGFGQITAASAWTVLGTGTAATVGDMALNADNAYNLGSASANVKTIFQYTASIKPVAIASLPGSPAAGMIAAVNNALAPVLGNAVAGTGSAFALVCYNGTAWKVMAT